MNSQSKGYSIILYLLWPLSALYIGLKNFNSKFGRNLLIALYSFLGFTAVSIGDLERYEGEYYADKGIAFTDLLAELLNLQTGKFYNSVIGLLSRIVFESHHFYFLFLFLIYGYFYIRTVHVFTESSSKKLNKIGVFFFLGVFLFMLIRPLPNLAFYTGGVFIVYCMAYYYKSNDKKYLYLLLLAPLIHIGLTIYLIVPVMLVLFKNRTWVYFIFLLFTFAAGKSNVVGTLGAVAQSNSGTILEEKFEAYASEDGQARLDERYATAATSKNINFKAFIILQNAIWYFFVPAGIVLSYFDRKKILYEDDVIMLFHIVILFWSVSNLMMNISQGERFVVLHSFVSVGLFYVIYSRQLQYSIKSYFTSFLYLFVPILFLYGLMAAYASNILFRPEFFISNYFVEVFMINSGSY